MSLHNNSTQINNKTEHFMVCITSMKITAWITDNYKMQINTEHNHEISYLNYLTMLKLVDDKILTFWRQLFNGWNSIFITVTIVKHFVIRRQTAIEELVWMQTTTNNNLTLLNHNSHQRLIYIYTVSKNPIQLCNVHNSCDLYTKDAVSDGIKVSW